MRIQKRNFMGVMTCDHKNCDNIMCNTYIHGVGYICYNCKEEFKKYLSKNNITANTEHQIIEELKTYMSTPVGYYNDNPIVDVDTFFNEHSK